MTRHLSDEQLGALIEVMLLAAFADGVFGPEEKDRFLDFVASLNDGRLSSSEASGLVMRAALLIQGEGREARLAAAKRTLADEEARELAVAMAVNVAAADGMDAKERAQIRSIAQALEIDEATLAEMLASDGGWVAPSAKR